MPIVAAVEADDVWATTKTRSPTLMLDALMRVRPISTIVDGASAYVATPDPRWTVSDVDDTVTTVLGRTRVVSEVGLAVVRVARFAPTEVVVTEVREAVLDGRDIVRLAAAAPPPIATKVVKVQRLHRFRRLALDRYTVTPFRGMGFPATPIVTGLREPSRKHR